MRIAVAADAEHHLVEVVTQWCADRGHTVDVLGVGVPWPDAGRAVGEAVAGERAERGVVMCWSGTGVSIAANKVSGVRAALCGDRETAVGARRWNDANVLALSMRLTTAAVAEEILAGFLGDVSVDADEVDHIARLEPERP